MKAKSTDVEDLQCAIYDMHEMTQDGLAEISAIAKLALCAMESPTNQPDMDTLARAFSAIWMRAEHLEGCIATEAISRGCASEGIDALRRAEARIASQNRSAK